MPKDQELKFVQYIADLSGMSVGARSEFMLGLDTPLDKQKEKLQETYDNTCSFLGQFDEFCSEVQEASREIEELYQEVFDQLDDGYRFHPTGKWKRESPHQSSSDSSYEIESPTYEIESPEAPTGPRWNTSSPVVDDLKNSSDSAKGFCKATSYIVTQSPNPVEEVPKSRTRSGLRAEARKDNKFLGLKRPGMTTRGQSRRRDPFQSWMSGKKNLVGKAATGQASSNKKKSKGQSGGASQMGKDPPKPIDSRKNKDPSTPIDSRKRKSPPNQIPVVDKRKARSSSVRDSSHNRESDDPGDRTSHRRSSTSPPTKIVEVKDDNSIRKFELVARRTKELQLITTWADPYDIEDKPKLQFSLMSYDEMIPEPTKAYRSRFQRPEGGVFSFLVPKGFDTKAMGEKLEAIGKEMKNGVNCGSNWKIVDDIQDHHVRLFGDKKFRVQGTGTNKNKQAAKFHSVLGRGYTSDE